MPDEKPSHATAEDFAALDDFDAVDTARMDIVPPGGSRPIGWVDFAGPGHPKTRQMSDDATRKRLYEERQRQINNRWKPAEKTPDQVAEENVKFIVDRIIDWSIKGRASDGKIVDVSFTHRAAMDLIKDPKKQWFFIQCLDFIAYIENFMPASSQS